jgi:hypothetical protein
MPASDVSPEDAEGVDQAAVAQCPGQRRRQGEVE